MNRAKQLIFIDILIVTLTLVIAGSSNTCQIDQTFSYGGIEVQCIRHRGTNTIEVICNSDDWTAFSPEIQFDLDHSYVLLTFVNCSFPENLNLLNVSKSLGVGGSPDLFFAKLRSPPTRQNLHGFHSSQVTFVNSNLSNLSFDMLYGVSDIESLIMIENTIGPLPRGFFRNWTKNLRSLHFLFSDIQAIITKDDLAHLTKLTELILFKTEITEIEAGAFDTLSNLKLLDISMNGLRKLPPGIFHRLGHLERLNLGQNPFDELPQDLLSGINDSHLKHFRMNYMNGSLKTLPNEFFKKLPYLREVHLEASQLENLSSDLFAGTSELEKLNLKNNSLTSLPSGFFNSFQKLQKLTLADNQITKLPANIFQKLDHLEDLDISYNDLTSLNSDILNGLSTLTTLNASHNNLIKVDDDLCSHLTSIKVIDLSFNRLTFQSSRMNLLFQRPSIFMSCKSLNGLHLSNNLATGLFDDTGFRGYIDLSNNNLTKLTAVDIDNMRGIGTLNIRNNSISKINLTELQSVVERYKEDGNKLSDSKMKILLGNNPLHCDCNLIDFARYWNSKPNSELQQYVKLMANDFDSDVYGNIQCASPPELKHRDISSLRLEELNCPLKINLPKDACAGICDCREYPAKRTLSVDCSYRNLKQLPETIANPYNWSIELNMSHNSLLETPSLKRYHLKNLVSLDLSNNQISTVTIDVFSASLVDLRLHDNKLSRLDERVLEHLEKDEVLRSITLDGNPWICDCEAHRFYSFVQKKVLAYKLFEVACSGTNEKLYAITTSELCNSLSIAIIIAIGIAILILGIIIGFAIPLYYRYQRKVKVLPSVRQCYVKLFANNEHDKNFKCDPLIQTSDKTKRFDEREIIVKLQGNRES